MSAYLIFTLGIIFGSLVSNILFRIGAKKGVLRIDHSNPEKDVYRFEIDDVATRSTKKFILKVDHNADLSQE